MLVVFDSSTASRAQPLLILLAGSAAASRKASGDEVGWTKESSACFSGPPSPPLTEGPLPKGGTESRGMIPAPIFTRSLRRLNFLFLDIWRALNLAIDIAAHLFACLCNRSFQYPNGCTTRTSTHAFDRNVPASLINPGPRVWPAPLAEPPRNHERRRCPLPTTHSLFLRDSSPSPVSDHQSPRATRGFRSFKR